MHLKQAVENAELLGTYELHLRSREGVAARTAQMEVSVVKVIYPPPKLNSNWVKQCGIKQLTMHAVVVREVGAEKGVTPICWTLLTSLAVNSFRDAWQVVEDYEHRWQIEEYHKVIKSGCSVEQHSLSHGRSPRTIDWCNQHRWYKILQLKLIGRNQPDAKAVKACSSELAQVPETRAPKDDANGSIGIRILPRDREARRLPGRKHDGEPGWITIWRGYQKMQSLLDGMRLAGAL